MNVMKVAHNQAKLIKVGTDMTYRQALSVALKQAHKAYKALVAALQTRFRSLFKIKSVDGKVLAMVTGSDKFNAIDRYTLKAQDFQEVKAEQISIGYPQDECKIY